MRFSDDATDPGEALERHYDICKREGRAYWGWINKRTEQVPVALLSHLNLLATKSDLQIHLFHAYELKLYSARLLKAHWKDDLHGFTSPLPWLTPGYYRGRRCSVWFELTAISAKPVEPPDLSRFSWVVPSVLFGDRVIVGSSAHHSNMLPTLEQLDEQNCSLWFGCHRKDGESSGIHSAAQADRALISRRLLFDDVDVDRVDTIDPVGDEASWDVFIAYAKEDVGDARLLHDRLLPYCKVFLDVNSVPLGEPWDIAVGSALTASSIVVVLISKKSKESIYLREEVAATLLRVRGGREQVRLIPIFGSPDALVCVEAPRSAA